MEELYNRANTLIMNGNYEESLSLYQQAIELYQKITTMQPISACNHNPQHPLQCHDAMPTHNSNAKNSSSNSCSKQQLCQVLRDDIIRLELLLRIYANIGYCQWKLRNYSTAIDYFQGIIDFYHKLTLSFPHHHNHHHQGLTTTTSSSSSSSSSQWNYGEGSFSDFKQSLNILAIKSMIRRCYCHEMIQEYEKCLSDLEEIESFEKNMMMMTTITSIKDKKEPSSTSSSSSSSSASTSASASFQRILESFLPNRSNYRKKIKELLRKDQQVSKEEGTLSWMSHLQQTIRILLLSPLNQSLLQFSSVTRWQLPRQDNKDHDHEDEDEGAVPAVDQDRCYTCYSLEIDCKIGLGNELGLFNRSLYLQEQNTQLLGKLICRLRHSNRNPSNQSHTTVFLTKDPICNYPLIHVDNIQCTVTLEEIEAILESDGKEKNILSFDFPTNGKVHVSMYINIISKDERMNNESLLLSEIIEFTVEEFVCPNVSIIPLLSTPFAISCECRTTEQGDLIDNYSYRLHFEDHLDALDENYSPLDCIRPIHLPNTTNCCIYIYESPGLLGIGGKIWDSTFVLIDYLLKHAEEYITDRSVFELGSGTGVAGLSLAYASPKKVILTDMVEVVSLISKNIQLNQRMQSESRVKTLLEHQYVACEYLWGSDEDLLRQANPQLLDDLQAADTMIASDVIYYPEGYLPLFTSLEWWFSMQSRKRLILAHRHRHPQDGEFFHMVAGSKVLRMKEILRDVEDVSVKDVRLFEFTKLIE